MINSNLSIIIEEVNNFLEISSPHPEITPSDIGEIRDKLVNYCLTKIEKSYIVKSQKLRQELKSLPKLPYRSLELRLLLEKHISEGSQKIIPNYLYSSMLKDIFVL